MSIPSQVNHTTDLHATQFEVRSLISDYGKQLAEREVTPGRMVEIINRLQVLAKYAID